MFELTDTQKREARDWLRDHIRNEVGSKLKSIFITIAKEKKGEIQKILAITPGEEKGQVVIHEDRLTDDVLSQLLTTVSNIIFDAYEVGFGDKFYNMIDILYQFDLLEDGKGKAGTDEFFAKAEEIKKQSLTAGMQANQMYVARILNDFITVE